MPVANSEDRNARVLLRAINSDLGHVDFFTRDDLLQLPVFGHIATITRYFEVCHAVNALLEKGDLVSFTKRRLGLPRKANRYGAYAEVPLSVKYARSVQKIVTRLRPNDAFSVMDVVHMWQMDQHLSEDNKRQAVRGALKDLARKGVVKSLRDHNYALVPGAAA